MFGHFQLGYLNYLRIFFWQNQSGQKFFKLYFLCAAGGALPDRNVWKRQISQFGGEPGGLPAKYRQNGKICNQPEKVSLALSLNPESQVCSQTVLSMFKTYVK